MDEKIFTGLDVAKRDGLEKHSDWIRLRSIQMARRGIIGKAWQGEIGGEVVEARVDFGRWIADCPDCGGAEYVDPGEPIFFCLSCGNVGNGYQARAVAFPEEKERVKIEARLLKLEVGKRQGMMCMPAEGSEPRNWRF